MTACGWRTEQGRQEAKGVAVAGGWEGSTLTRTVESHWWYSLSLPGERGDRVLSPTAALCAPESPGCSELAGLESSKPENTEAPMPYALKEAAASCHHRLPFSEI